MDTYFDILPQDVISVILIKIENVGDFIPLNDIHNFRDVISKPYFWSLKTKLSLSNIDFKYIPTFLLDFSKSFEIKLMNYATLIHSYQELNSVLTEWQNGINKFSEGFGISGTGYKYHLWSVNNFDVLRLDLFKPDKVKILLAYFLNYKTQRLQSDGISLNLFNNGTCRMDIHCLHITMRTYIPKIDAINFFTYVIFNNLS